MSSSMGGADGRAQNATSIPAEVAAIFHNCVEPTRTAMLEVRELILATAAETPGVGAITETLKWGQPAYLTNETRSGSTIRIAPTRLDSDHDFAVFFICHTNLVESFKSLLGDTLAYDGNRALLFSYDDPLPVVELRECLKMALTYHLSTS